MAASSDEDVLVHLAQLQRRVFRQAGIPPDVALQAIEAGVAGIRAAFGGFSVYIKRGRPTLAQRAEQAWRLSCSGKTTREVAAALGVTEQHVYVLLGHQRAQLGIRRRPGAPLSTNQPTQPTGARNAQD